MLSVVARVAGPIVMLKIYLERTVLLIITCNLKNDFSLTTRGDSVSRSPGEGAGRSVYNVIVNTGPLGDSSTYV